MIDKELLDILACPKCKGELEYRPTENGKSGSLLCHACNLQYEIIDDIPNLIIEDAKPIDSGAAQ